MPGEGRNFWVFFNVFRNPDPADEIIEQGSWKNENPYGVMHRMAFFRKRKGVASFCLDWCFSQCGNVRGDTHTDNFVMQRVFEKNGFEKCGIIYVEDGSPRIAYQRKGRGADR